MKKLALFLILFASTWLHAADFTQGVWRLSVSAQNGSADLYKGNTQILSRNSAAVKIDGVEYQLAALTIDSISCTAVCDQFGQGTAVSVHASVNADTKLVHTYYLYDNTDYILTQVSLLSDQRIRSNYMAPIKSDTIACLPEEQGNVLLRVPFDNDEWVRYKTFAFGNERNSYEVGTVFHQKLHNGLVLGSIQHTDWKTKITYATAAPNKVTKLLAFGGASDEYTRDSIAHGSLVGNEIHSPLMMIGLFADWREGMELYGDLCAIEAPKLEWNSGKPFAWNSWGVLQTNIRYMNASQSALFIADSLMSRGYQNDGVMYMDLDSYWDNMTGGDLRRFSQFCNARNQKSGIYWTPFVDWANNPDRIVEGTTNTRYKDIWLYQKGKPIKRTGAMACDPTHPGTKARMRHFIDNFSYWGYEFLKLDFMDHGIQEADHWYDTTVTTGVQAYCHGMAYLDSLIAGRMYLNLSIAPLFPAHFAHGRRIACDAYASVGNSEYTLNSTTYGWWLDHVYSYNDPDNIVFKGQILGVNRIRLGSALVTGMLCIGDDYSNSGDETAKQRAKDLLSNKDLMQMARETKSFRPLVVPTAGDSAASYYYTTVEDTAYVGLFNYGGARPTVTVRFAELGIEPGEYVVKELWEGAYEMATDQFSVRMPRQNCLFYKIYKGSIPPESALENVKGAKMKCYPNPCTNELRLGIPTAESVEIFSADSQLVASYKNTNVVNVSGLPIGCYTLRAIAEDKVYTSRFIKK